MFDNREYLQGVPLKSHLLHNDVSNPPSDLFLRLHFTRCLTVSACRGDIKEDYRVEVIEAFMAELGVYDRQIDLTNIGWTTPLGREIFTYLITQDLLKSVDFFYFIQTPH
jgi:hypothetical protein